MNADLQDLLNCLKNKKEQGGRVLICVLFKSWTQMNADYQD